MVSNKLTKLHNVLDDLNKLNCSIRKKHCDSKRLGLLLLKEKEIIGLIREIKTDKVRYDDNF